MKTALEPQDVKVIAEEVAAIMTPHIDRLQRLSEIVKTVKTYPKYLTAEQVAEITGISVATLSSYRLNRTGMPYIKTDRSIRYGFDDVIKWMEDHKILLD